MTNNYRLYGRRSSGSFAVQVALEQIGAPFELVWIGSEESEVAGYREVCPTGRVPALILPDGTLMFESAAMLIHLAHAHPEARLAPPPGTSQHAKFLQWMVFMSANLYESVLRIYYSDRYTSRGQADAAVVRARGLQDFEAHLDIVSRDLAPYLLGAEYSIADVYLSMLVAWHPDGREALFTRLPALKRHADSLSTDRVLSKVESEHAT